MAHLQFSTDEIAELARKIGELAGELSGKERTLLLAIFAAAAGSAKPAGAGEARLPEAEIRHEEEAELGDLQSQLLNAYIPGNSLDSLGGIVMYKIIPGDANGGNP
jgi:hypothetical protein